MLVLERNEGLSQKMGSIELWTIFLREFFCQSDNLVVKCFYLIQKIFLGSFLFHQLFQLFVFF